MVELATTPEDKRETRDTLLQLLSAAHIPAREVAALAGAVAQLAPIAKDKHQVRRALLSLLADQADGWAASELIAGVVQLDPTAQDKTQARKALLALLASQASRPLAARLVDGLVQLDPATRDINTWPTWAVPPTSELLAAVRRNSELPAWLVTLPTLAPLSGAPL